MNRQTIPQVVGANVRARRSASGITLEALAKQAKLYGLKWTTARIVELEAGRLAVGIPVLLVVAQALGDLTGARVKLADLLRSDSWLELNETLALSPSAVAASFDGELVDWRNSDVQGGLQDVSRAVGSVAEFLEEWAAEAPGFTFDELHKGASMKTGLAEERAAKALKLSVPTLNAYSMRLWGKSIGERRDELVPGGSPQARGHASRQLIEELREAVQANTVRRTPSRKPSFKDSEGGIHIFPSRTPAGPDVESN